MPARKPVFVRQLDAARQAQIAVVCEILSELGFIVERAVDIDSSILAECVIKGVDVDGVIREIEEAHVVVEQTALPSAGSTAPAQKVDEMPLCPKCGGEMAVRVVKNGPRAGSTFLGCLGYPACKGTRSVD